MCPVGFVGAREEQLPGGQDPGPREKAHEVREFGDSLGYMLETCEHVKHMTRMIQIRNVPEPLHRELKARAALAGQSLSDYLRTELERLAARPTLAAFLQRVRERTPTETRTTPSDAVRRERGRP